MQGPPQGGAGEPSFRRGWIQGLLPGTVCDSSVFLCRLSFHMDSSVNAPWGCGGGIVSRTYTLCTEMGVLRFPPGKGCAGHANPGEVLQPHSHSVWPPSTHGLLSAVRGSLQDMRQP